MNITLTLPPHITTSMVRWLSVWCKPFRANFGQIIFPSVAVVNIDHKEVGEKQDDNIDHKEVGEKQDDNIDHKELGEKQNDNNRTESRSDITVEEATEMILNEYVFEAPPVTEAVSEKMKEMKARQGKSFPDKSDKERMGVTEDDTKVESSDRERMDVAEAVSEKMKEM